MRQLGVPAASDEFKRSTADHAHVRIPIKSCWIRDANCTTWKHPDRLRVASDELCHDVLATVFECTVSPITMNRALQT